MIERFSSQVFSPQFRTDSNNGAQQMNSSTDSISKVAQTTNKTDAGQLTDQERNHKKEMSKEELQDIVEGLNKFMQPTHTSLRFKFHEKLNEYYVQVINQDTNETIREIPSQKVLDLYASMLEHVGILVDKKI